MVQKDKEIALLQKCRAVDVLGNLDTAVAMERRAMVARALCPNDALVCSRAGDEGLTARGTVDLFDGVRVSCPHGLALYAVGLLRRIKQVVDARFQPFYAPVEVMRQHSQFGVGLVTDEGVELHVVLDGLRFFCKMEMQSIDMRNVEDVG